MTGAVVIQLRSMAKPQEHLPNRVREWRTARKLTLKQLAPQVGITFGHLGAIEKGVRELTWPVMQRIAAALRVDAADLINHDEGGLTPHERDLIRTYRQAAPAGRAAIESVAESQRAFIHQGEVIPFSERKAG